MAERFGLSVKKSEGKERTPSAGKMRPGVSPGMDMGSPVEQVLHLQRTIGNRAVTRLVESGALQARLRVGAPNDIYEQEAERIADRVMAMTAAENPGIRRQTEEEVQTKLQRQTEEEKEETAQAKAAPGTAPEVTPNIESNINAMKGGGQPLSESTRSFFEPRFGTDFSHVRLHTDTNAANTAQSINAKAFTTGKDIASNSGQYSPGTSSGKHLLAHELTHVVQQNKSSPVFLTPETNISSQFPPQMTLSIIEDSTLKNYIIYRRGTFKGDDRLRSCIDGNVRIANDEYRISVCGAKTCFRSGICIYHTIDEVKLRCSRTSEWRYYRDLSDDIRNLRIATVTRDEFERRYPRP
jgi:hypothetical protein